MVSGGFDYVRPRPLIDKIAGQSWPLVLVLCLLTLVGVAAQYSVAGGTWEPWAQRHAVRFLFGLALLVALGVVPLKVWFALAYPAYVVALLLLLLVPLFGSEALGARRWLTLGPVGFQPSELMKVALVAALARYFHGFDASSLSRPQWVLIPVAAILLPAVLIARQPDLGTAVLIVVSSLGVMVMAGVHPGYFIAAGAAALVAGPLAVGHLHDYQRRRLETFLNPENDPLGAGYHITQSKIALGSGGVSGKGFLQGTQSQLDFLPEKHTDFIFTTIGEEWGFVGAVAVLALFALLLLVLLAMALSARNPFARLLSIGAGLVIFAHVAINVGMVTGLVPVVGVPLPFISYGGTSMITLLFTLGLAMSGYVHRADVLGRPWPGTTGLRQV